MSGYERVPTSDLDATHPSGASPRTASEDLHDEPPLSRDQPLSASTRAEFNRPAPAWWKRIAVVFAMLFFGWLAVRLGGLGSRKPQVIYATRYSDEFKYRPAASPVITEHLKDGRIRIRGASVAAMGVREEDIPKSPAQKKREEEERVREAREAAKARLGLKKKGGKGKGGKRSTEP